MEKGKRHPEYLLVLNYENLDVPVNHMEWGWQTAVGYVIFKCKYIVLRSAYWT